MNRGVVYRHKGIMIIEGSLESFNMRQKTHTNEERGDNRGMRRAPLRLSINLDSILGARGVNIHIQPRNDPGESLEYGVESKRNGDTMTDKYYYVNFSYGVEDNGILSHRYYRGNGIKRRKTDV